MKRTLGALALCALMAAGCGSGPYNADNEAEMKSQCEGFAAKRLQSPGSAEFTLVANRVGDQWKVTGVVDSENGFGALLRSDVSCVMHIESDTVYLDDISVTPN